MKKLFLGIFPFFFLIFSLFPSPAEAQGQHPDKNIKRRGWVSVSGARNLIPFDHLIDTRAPQLSTLIAEVALPTITSLHQVNGWDWDNDQPLPPETEVPADAPADFANMVGFAADGRAILVPESGYTLGGGFEAFVLYADDDSITLQYTCDDSVASGYTIHLVGFDVDDRLVELYNQLDSAGREELPVLKPGARIGVGIGEILVATRDTGSFLDPRWEKDWWQQKTATSGQDLELNSQSVDECAGAGTDPNFCPALDLPTDRCCPLTTVNIPSSVPELIDTLLGAVFKAEVKLKEGKELEPSHVRRLTQRYLGTPQEDFNDGVMRKLMPPNHNFIKSESVRRRVYNSFGRWEIEMEGLEDEPQRITGDDEYLSDLNYATAFLRDALTKIPGQETGTSGLPSPPVETNRREVLAKNSGEKKTDEVVLAAAAVSGELCHEELPGEKYPTCAVERSTEISFTRALREILGRQIKFYPRFSFLQDIFAQTVPTTFAIFDTPGETHEQYDGDADGKFKITISLDVPIDLPFIDLPEEVFNVISVDVEKEARVWQTGTVSDVDQNSVQKKLTPPSP